MEQKISYGFDEMEVGEFKEFHAPHYRDRAKIKAAAWGFASYWDKKFTSTVLPGGIRITRTK